MEVTVACVLWQGKFKYEDGVKRPFSPMWVKRLRNMVKRNLSMEHEFVCFSNVDVPGVNVIELKHDLPAFWSKMEVYRPDALTMDRILYLDLDVIPLQDLEAFVNFPTEFAIGAPFGNANKKWPSNVRYGYNNSVVVMDKHVCEPVWKMFIEKKDEWMNLLRHDQDWLQECFPGQQTFPKEWLAKAGNCIKGDDLVPPKKCKLLLCMPEKNNVLAGKYEFVKERWK